MKVRIIMAMMAIWTLNSVTAYADVLNNRVSVLHSGYVQPIEGRGFLPGAQTDGARKVASTISLVQASDIVLIADPGMAASGVWDQILNRLQLKGEKPEDVTHVFISHHHPDHVSKVGLFPNATIVDFWATYKNDLWSDHPDNYELAPGVKVIRTPGHTNEDSSLLVETREGTYALTHLWWTAGYEPKEDPLAEDAKGISHSRELVLKQADWIIPGHGAMFRNSKKKVNTVSDKQGTKLTEAVQKGSDAWVNAFNKGDAVAAANAYDESAMMNVVPFGTFIGRKNIQVFWEDLISQGYAKVRYIDPVIEIINARAAVISSKWKMNKAQGVITKELWVLDDEGQAKLRIDNFEVVGDN